ncbi:MAG: Gfo/Idh/MocA family oxidoreductase [Planctomycetales bacterium]|nr:Gfo/Idh/MocA family oxidoreductase [Planctomycetales bacterium]
MTLPAENFSDSLLLKSIEPVLPVNRSPGIGCIGAGFIMADCQLVAYRQHGLNPVAITSRTRATAEKVAARHEIKAVCDSVEAIVSHPEVEVLDIAVPPDCQLDVIRRALTSSDRLRGILAQKPLGVDYREALEIVRMCEDAGVVLAVNQNMRFDQSVRACRTLLDHEVLGKPVLATIDMRAIPHWMPWQERQGWVTLRIMSIHHMDTLRYWLGEPDRIFASIAPDPRTSQKFEHEDGIALYILEFPDDVRASSWDDVWAGPAREGCAADIGIRWRVEGTEGIARGTVGWPSYPERTPSTLEYSTRKDQGRWHSPKWDHVWFPDAFIGPMAELLCALEEDREPTISGRQNLPTMALVDAAYRSAEEHRAINPREIMDEV